MKKINPLKRLDSACFLRSQLYLAPVLLLFYQQNGLTIADFVLFQGIFQLTGILFEIPCGYIADVISKKKVLVLAFVCFIFSAPPCGLVSPACISFCSANFSTPCREHFFPAFMTVIFMII